MKLIDLQRDGQKIGIEISYLEFNFFLPFEVPKTNTFASMCRKHKPINES